MTRIKLGFVQNVNDVLGYKSYFIFTIEISPSSLYNKCQKKYYNYVTTKHGQMVKSGRRDVLGVYKTKFIYHLRYTNP